MLTVDIWSDVVCPFCYMGKRRFEKALAGFEHRDEVGVTWHSFQLDPDARYRPGQTVHQYLADRKGVSVVTSRRLHERLVAEAAELGLRYDFDAALIANTFDAHRLTHMARALGRQSAVEEALFAAYFSHGKNIEDHDVLAALAGESGIDATEAAAALATDRYAQEVRADIEEARRLGADGVPFYVFNRAYAVSGAQPPEVFLEVLNGVHAEGEPAASKAAGPAAEG